MLVQGCGGCVHAESCMLCLQVGDVSGKGIEHLFEAMNSHCCSCSHCCVNVNLNYNSKHRHRGCSIL